MYGAIRCFNLCNKNVAATVGQWEQKGTEESDVNMFSSLSLFEFDRNVFTSSRR